MKDSETHSKMSEIDECRVKKLKLQIQYLELENYKKALEIYQLESSLQLPHSKYSEHIAANISSMEYYIVQNNIGEDHERSSDS